jgi:hypothetical protein
MPSRPLPNLLLESFFDLGEDGWKDANDLNMLKLSVLVQAGASGKFAAEPGAPAAGDIIVLDETHATHPNAIAVYDDGAWVYFTPSEGWLIYNRATNEYLTYDAAAWTALATGGGGGAILPTPVTGQAASYTAVLGDANSYIRMNVAGANTFTVPANATVAFPIGTRLYVEQRGAGVTTITPDAGVTIRSRGGVYGTGGQYAVAALIKVDTDTWVLSGDVA